MKIISIFFLFVGVCTILQICEAKLPPDWNCSDNGQAYRMGDIAIKHICCIESTGEWSLRNVTSCCKETDVIQLPTGEHPTVYKCNVEEHIINPPVTKVEEETIDNDVITDEETRGQKSTAKCSPENVKCCNGQILDENHLCTSYNQPMKKGDPSHDKICGNKTYKEGETTVCCRNKLRNIHRCHHRDEPPVFDQPIRRAAMRYYPYYLEVKRRAKDEAGCVYIGKLYAILSENEKPMDRNKKVMLLHCKRLRRKNVYILLSKQAPEILGNPLIVDGYNVFKIRKETTENLKNYWKKS